MSWIGFGVDVFVRHIWVKLQANEQKHAKKKISWKLVQNWRDIWRKSVRFFRTQLIVSGFYNVSILALCWRKCGMTGDRSHIFWDCPVLQGFWQKNWTNNENCLPSGSSIVSTWAAPQNVTLKDQNIRCTQMLIRGNFFLQRWTPVVLYLNLWMVGRGQMYLKKAIPPFNCVDCLLLNVRDSEI